MTNTEIIFDCAVANGIFTEEQAIAHLEQNGCLPLHTFNEWRKMGYCVRKGEKAKMVCDIWRMTNYKKDKKAENADSEKEEKDDHFYMKTAYFFTAEQVERIETA